jgi:hypothetical protein
VNIYPKHTLFPALAVHYSPTRRVVQRFDAPKP